jgi:hypothetical protein
MWAFSKILLIMREVDFSARAWSMTGISPILEIHRLNAL